jgi:hypothetical protein
MALIRNSSLEVFAEFEALAVSHSILDKWKALL